MCIVRARLPVQEPRRWLKRREAKGVERAREFVRVVLVIVPCTLVGIPLPWNSFSYRRSGGYTAPQLQVISRRSSLGLPWRLVRPPRVLPGSPRGTLRQRVCRQAIDRWSPSGAMPLVSL